MSYNLTDRQQSLVKWLVEQAREGNLVEDFSVFWENTGALIQGYSGAKEDLPEITPGLLDALALANMLVCNAEYHTSDFRVSSLLGPRTVTERHEISRRCTLTRRAYDAVDSNFETPDISFVKHLSPLADVASLDNEIKTRCLPILGAGSVDPKLWDSAVRTSGVILEERLRDVGGITNPGRVGRDLVNDVFGQSGTLSGKFSVDSERQGYRDLYAGVVGAFRNPYGHRFVDPSPEDGGAFIVFVNLLLKMLEDLR